MIKVIKFIFAVFICEGIGILGSFFTVPAISTWYAVLTKPFFNPPNFIFGPVWTILYLLMGISLYLVWITKSGSNLKTKAIQFFAIQLFLNFLWSIVFFRFYQIGLAFVVILLLWVSIFETIRRFSKIDKNSALLLYPYLAWVSFASILNFSIMILNGF